MGLWFELFLGKESTRRVIRDAPLIYISAITVGVTQHWLTTNSFDIGHIIEVGVITLAAEIIAAHNKKTFTFTNSYIAATSTIIVSTQSEGGEFIWANSGVIQKRTS